MIPPPPPPPATETPGDATGNTNGEELLEAEKWLQKEEEKYDLYGRIYVGQLSKEAQTAQLIAILHQGMNIYKL